MVTEEQKQNLDRKVVKSWESDMVQYSEAAMNELKRKEQQLQEREQAIKEREQRLERMLFHFRKGWQWDSDSVRGGKSRQFSQPSF